MSRVVYSPKMSQTWPGAREHTYTGVIDSDYKAIMVSQENTFAPLRTITIISMPKLSNFSNHPGPVFENKKLMFSHGPVGEGVVREPGLWWPRCLSPASPEIWLYIPPDPK